MKKRFGILFGFLVLALLDCVFSYAMPIDFTYQKLSVVWHFYFIGLLVFTRDKPWLTRILLGLLAGIVSDLFFTNSFPFCFMVYPLFSWLIGLPKGRMEGNEFAFACYMGCLFGLDFLPWIYSVYQGVPHPTLAQWLYSIELLTLICGGLCTILVMYVDIVMDRFFLIQKHMHRREQQKQPLKRKIAQMPNSNHPARKRRSR